MPATEPIQGGPYPEPSDPPDGPNQMAALVTWAAPRTVMRFASTTARDSAIPSPVEGMVAITGTGAGLRQWLYVAGAWRDVTAGLWTAWTPTWSGVTLGNGTSSGRYQLTPGGLVVRAQLSLGSSSSVSGQVTLVLPEAVVTSLNVPRGTAQVIDASASNRRYLGACLLTSATTLIGLVDTGGGGAPISTNVPVTLASGDSITFEAYLERAM